MDNSIHNDEQIVQRQVIKKYNGARPWQVAVLMLMSAAVAAMVLFVALLGGKGRYRLIDGGAKYDSSLISTLLSEIDKYYYFHDDAPTPIRGRKRLASGARSPEAPREPRS